MKIVFKPENPIERIATKAKLVPYPSTAFIMAFAAKIAMLAFKFDVFEAAKDSPQTIEDIAQKVNTSEGSEKPLECFSSRGLL